MNIQNAHKPFLKGMLLFKTLAEWIVLFKGQDATLYPFCPYFKNPRLRKRRRREKGG
jgi:hypothetical protein